MGILRGDPEPGLAPCLLSSFCGPGLGPTLPQEALCSLRGLGNRGTCRKSAGVRQRKPMTLQT